jgi:hypothetical protein
MEESKYLINTIVLNEYLGEKSVFAFHRNASEVTHYLLVLADWILLL